MEQEPTEQTKQVRPVLIFPELSPPAEEESGELSPDIISKDNLTELVEQKHISNATSLLDAMYRSLKRQLRKDNPKTAELVAQMYGLVKSSGGIVINNLMQQNNISAEEKFYFENIIRQMEENDRPSGKVL